MSFNKVIIYLLYGSIINFTSINAFASMKILSNYDELLQTIESDSNIKVLIYLNRCKVKSGSIFETPIMTTFTTTSFDKFQDGLINLAKQERGINVTIAKNNRHTVIAS